MRGKKFSSKFSWRSWKEFRGRNTTSLHASKNKSSYELPLKNDGISSDVHKNHRSSFVALAWNLLEYQGKVKGEIYPCKFLTSIKIIWMQKYVQFYCIWQSVVYMMLLFASSIKMIIVRIVCTPVFVGEGGWTSNQIFKKGKRLDRTSTFREGLLGKRGVNFFRGGEGAAIVT